MLIEKFVKQWNAGYIKPTAPDDAYNAWADSLFDEYARIINEVEPRSYVGVSSLHLPVCLNILTKHGLVLPDYSPMSRRMHLVLGYVWENTILFMMRDCGLVQVDKEQFEIVHKGIKGHIDAYLPEEDMVIDIKSMSGFYHRQFCEDPDDNRGYITQVLTYKRALGCSRAGILAANKATNMLQFVEIVDDMDYRRYEEYVYPDLIHRRVDMVCDALANSQDINDIFDYPIEIVCNPLNKRQKYLPHSCKYDVRTKYWVEIDKYGNICHQYTEGETYERVMRDYNSYRVDNNYSDSVDGISDVN